MSSFYGCINDYKSENLLKATPYTHEPINNFGYSITKEFFFEHLYMARSSNNEDDVENKLFDNKIDYALRDIYNKYAKVSMVHISGYAGCGKTTYIHHLLWERRFVLGTYDVIDYEGCKRAVEPFILRLAHLLCKYNHPSDIINYLNQVKEGRVYNTNRFRESLPELGRFLEMLRNLSQSQITENEYRILLDKLEEPHINSESEEKTFLAFLLFLEFMLLLFDKFISPKMDYPMILVIDNSDSLHNLSEELILLPVLKEFVNDCNYFFGANLINDALYNNISIKHVCQKTKLLLFFTTRVVTIQHYEIIEPDWEKIHGWISLALPEHYYYHKEIILKRIDYYLSHERNTVSPIVDELKQIRSLTSIAYHNNNFMRLFNGNIRICIERICSIIKNYPKEAIDEINSLYLEKDNNPDVIEGFNGYFLSLVLYDFKKEGVYEAKLGLSKCQKDGAVSLSRIVMTIIREKSDRCSLLDLFQLLTPLNYDTEEICKCVWSLCEEKREYWRRLLIFDLIIPNKYEKLLEQAGKFKSGDIDIEHYSELVMCTAGKAYMEFVIPHFEFMLSRHELGIDTYGIAKYQPLFSDKSEKEFTNKKGHKVYSFEQKIDWVYNDVKDCCYNSRIFSERVLDVYKIDRSKFIKSTVFNYHSVGWDGNVGPKQSYESRLIFRHISYIEKYRSYLLWKYSNENEKKKEINKSLVTRIIRYLKLYQDSHRCFQTETQNTAAQELLKLAGTISQAGYTDFKTRIELL